MSDEKNDDPFFIGWEGDPSVVPVKHSKSRSLIFVVIALAIAGVAAALQTNFNKNAKWDYTEKEFEGVFLAKPYPTLLSGDKVYYLVLETKHGFPADAAADLHQRLVKVKGSVIEDTDQPTSMIAVLGADSVTKIGNETGSFPELTAAPKEVTLRGEIADSKCALGAMNPGVFKPHRACAINCLEGGIPPILIVRHGEGEPASHYLIVSDFGERMKEATIEYAALPVEVTGKVSVLGDWKILNVNPQDIRLIE